MKTTRFAILSFMLVCGTAAYADTFGSDPIRAHDALLGEATGYFADAGGTGGQGGRVVYVTNLNDSGPGSMRSFLESTETLIVLFEDGVNGTINLSEEIKVESNKTLWGRHQDGSSADIFIRPTNQIAAFKVVQESNNVIFANLKADAPGPNDSAPDWLVIRDTGTVWVHHVTAIGDGTQNMDGFVDAHAEGVTLSWNRVLNWDNVHLLYPALDPTGDVTVTLHHNLFRDNKGRQPQLSQPNTFAHAYNNWIDNWGGHGMRTTDGGELRADGNIFTAGEDDDAIKGNWAGAGNVFLNGAGADSQSSGIFTPPYSYTTDLPDQMLRDRLEAEAGWQSVLSIPDGDFDFNGKVNGFDFLHWQRDPSVGALADWEATYGTTPIQPGDFDGNGEVSGFDFLLWQRDPSVGSLADWEAIYGTVAALSASSAAVPEPTTSALALAALCLAMSRRRSF